MYPDWNDIFTMKIDKAVFDKLTQNEAEWKNEWQQSLESYRHPDVTARPGLKPRRDL